MKYEQMPHKKNYQVYLCQDALAVPPNKFSLHLHIEMRTGRLIKGWENDSHNGTGSMNVADIAKAIKKKDRQARVILGDLITNGFINKHKDGYYLNREYVVRGKSWESDL